MMLRGLPGDDFVRMTREIKIGNIAIGAGNSIAVQSMTNTNTADFDATLAQILMLEEAGCDIVRSTFNTPDCADSFKRIRKCINIPIVADIHFDYKLAVLAACSGADKIRINPGNIGGEKEIREVVKAATDAGIPIRVGANTGSIDRNLIEEKGHAAALVESTIKNVDIIASMGFENIVISLKASDASVCIEAAEMISKLTDFPLHIGVTEAGLYEDALIKSAMGLGAILIKGIGDTIRVSITGDPVREIKVAKKILSFAGGSAEGVEIISCPTCGRCSLDIERIAKEIEEKTTDIKKKLKIAVMGCAVNGPGEARDADFGVAGGKNEGLLFVKGNPFKKVSENDIVKEIVNIIREVN